jgi:hypothetical protein
MAAVAQRGNLDSSAKDSQMRVGLVALAAAMLAAVLLAQSGAAAGVRALSFVPFFVASYGILSALYGVCGFTALAGRRITTEGTERVADRFELTCQRRSGMRVLVLSAAFAALATGLFVAAS